MIKGNVEQRIKEFQENMNQVKKEFEKLIESKEVGKALKVAIKFTDEIEKFHEDVALTDSLEEIFLILNKIQFPIELWRDFLEDYSYFDDEELMIKWIDIEKKYYQKKRAFEDDQRVIFINLDAYQNSITILAYFDDFENADIKWIAAKALLSRIIDPDIKKKWKAFEEEYLRWKENYQKGIDKYFIKIDDDLKQKVEELTKVSLELLHKGKIEESFIKQAEIVELLESFFD